MSTSTTREAYATLQYYLRERLWRHAQTLANDKFTALNDFTFLLWKAFTLDLEGQVADALREYKNCEGKRGVHTAALYGIQLIYKRNNDADGSSAIAQRLLEEERQPNPSASLQAACLLWHAGETSQARDLLNKLLDQDAEFRDEYTSVQLIRGWVDLTAGRGLVVDKCAQMFDRVLAAEKVDNLFDVDATMGKVAVLERKQQFWPAQELLNKCTVACPNFLPALVVKAKQLMRVEDWEQTMEIVTRILARDSINIEALILQALVLLVKDGKPTQASRSIADLIKALQQREPRNAHLYLACAQCFSRLAGGNLTAITVTTSLAESAAQMQPHNTDIASEVAYQSLLRGDHRTAATLYKKASTAGDGNIVPLLGLIKCTVLAGSLDDAEKQIDFLTEIQTPQTKNAELLFLTAMLRWRKAKDRAGSLEKLDKAVDAHRQEYASQPAGMDLIAKLNPHFMLEMAREYAQHCRSEPVANSRPDPVIEKTRRLLEQLLRNVPASTEAQLLNCRMAFAAGDVERALSIITASIRQDQTLSEAQLLHAKILLYAKNNSGASQALEQALALDFDMYDSPQFNLLKGTLLYMKDEFGDALTSLQRAVNLVDKQATAAAAGNPPQNPMSPQDQVSLHLQLAQTHLRLKAVHESEQTISKALVHFQDTPHGGRLVIAKALLTARSDVEKAFGLLRSVPTSSPQYLDAKAQMARLYLTQRGNRRAFAQCYEEVAEAVPSVQSFMNLGDAYTSIQEPSRAIEAYEKARHIDPNNAELSVKIGRTLVTTHDYQRALRYYRDAVAAEGHRVGLRTDLACLYWRLGDHPKAIQVLRDAPVMSKPPAQDDLTMGIERVQLALLQAKVLKGAGDVKGYVESLIQARVFQNNVVTKARADGPDTAVAQRNIGTAICIELGNYYRALPTGKEKAIQFYNEALKHDEANVPAMLALAQLHMDHGDLEGCEMQCNALLRVKPDCEEASVMLADMMFRRGRFNEAAYHSQQQLEKQPGNVKALVHHVRLLRKAGRLADAGPILDTAESQIKPGQKKPPGLCYARGLFHRHTGMSREALAAFNAGRLPKDGPFAQPCVRAMIEVYINPEGANLWEDGEMNAQVMENLRTAEKLLPEVSADDGARTKFEALTLLASKRKDGVEKGLNMYFELHEAARQTATEQGDEEVSATLLVDELLGMAIAYQIMKQQPKARSQLKRLVTATPNLLNAPASKEDALESAFMLLAAIYIESGKYDLAQELLKKVTAANRGNPRSWEMTGLIHEKEQAYKDAAECYEKAWTIMGEKDPGTGFKLAFNYLKAKRYVAAIDVCHRVLAAHPNYPRIRKEVLDRARHLLHP